MICFLEKSSEKGEHEEGELSVEGIFWPYNY
jgi:hypothetical protein